MNTFNRFHRKRGKSTTREFVDTADRGLREPAGKIVWDSAQPLDHENQFDGLSDEAEPDPQFDDDNSEKRGDGIFSYLSAIGPIRILSREEELALARSITDGQTQIDTETLSSLFALRWVLDVGKKVATGLVPARDVIDEPAAAPENRAIEDRALESRFRKRMAKVKYLARRYERTSGQHKSSISTVRRKKLDGSLARQRQKIASSLHGLELNRGQIAAIIDGHELIFENLRKVERERGGKAQKLALHAIEAEMGMSAAEIRRLMTSTSDKQAAVALAKKRFTEANLPGRPHRKALLRQGPSVSRSHSGRKHRSDEGGGQIQPPPGISVFNLCQLVDTPGGHAGLSGPIANHPHPGSHG
jgi:hypothetical protein